MIGALGRVRMRVRFSSSPWLSPAEFSPVAQLAEQLTLDEQVSSSTLDRAASFSIMFA